MYVCALSACPVPMEIRRDIGSPGIGTVDSCELWVPGTKHLEEQKMSLITVTLLYPQEEGFDLLLKDQEDEQGC